MGKKAQRRVTFSEVSVRLAFGARSIKLQKQMLLRGLKSHAPQTEKRQPVKSIAASSDSVPTKDDG